MTTTSHIETPASSLAEAGDHKHMPRRGLPMRGRMALAAPRLLVFVLGGAVGACGGPPALTAAVSTTDQRPFSLDNVIGTQEPHNLPEIITAMESRPHRFGIDTVAKIQTKFTDAGGVCDRKSGQIDCYIERSAVVRECFRDNCATRQKVWTVRIRAPDVEGPIKPKVKITLRVSNS